MRLEAEAKNSSEKDRMREVRGAEMRSGVCQRWGFGRLMCVCVCVCVCRTVNKGALPMHVVPKVLSIWSGGMESVGVDWVS